MPLTDLRLLLKHCPEMGTVPVCHPDNVTNDAHLRLWWLVRYSHTQERFGSMTAAEIAAELVTEEAA